MRTRIITGSLLILVTASLAQAGVLFSSSWRSGTGTTETLQMDNGLWNTIYSADMMSVKRGAPSGHNYLAVTQVTVGQSCRWCGITQTDCHYDELPELYYRTYLRVWPLNPPTYQYHMMHGCEGQLGAIVYTGNDPSADFTSSWRAFMNRDPNLGPGPNQFATANLQFMRWYRVEGNIVWGGHTGYDPSIWHMRVYDDQDTLIRDDADWDGGSLYPHSLDYLYNVDHGTFLVDGTAKDWYLGNNGSASGVGSGRLVDYASATMRSDTWCGAAPVLGYYADFQNSSTSADWTPVTPSRWSVGLQNAGTNNNVYYINTSSYSEQSGNRLGELSFVTSKTFGDFLFTAQAATLEPVNGGNSTADYALVFGYQDANNYYYAAFNRTASQTHLFKVVGGTQQAALATYATALLSDTAYHDVSVQRAGSAITVLYDGTQVLSASDSTFLTGKFGVGSFNDAAAFDEICITPPNTAPTAGNDTFTFTGTSYSNTILTTLLTNDSDPQQDPLRVLRVTYASHGSILCTTDGTITYWPLGDYTGSDSFTYKVNDGQADSNTATVTFNVTAPDKALRTLLVDFGSTTTGSPGTDCRYWNNFTSRTAGTTVANCKDSVNVNTGIQAKITKSFDQSGSNPNFTADFVRSYPKSAAVDYFHMTASGTASVEFSNLDASGNTTYNFGLYATMNNSGAKSLWSLVGSSTTTKTVNCYTTATNYAAFNAITPDASGKIRVDVSLGAGALVAPLGIVQMDINHKPVAVNDPPNGVVYSVTSGQQLDVSAATGLLLNDTDGDSTHLTAIKVTDPANGTVTVNPDGSFSYTSNGGYVGTDSFTYKANDGFMDSNVATVNITVAAPDSITVASPNGQEVWPIGSTRSVSWTSTGSVGNVDIELSTDGGATWRPAPLAANTTNDASEGVSVPDAYSKTCRVRVKQTSGGSPSDTSDASFTITVPGDATLDGYVDGDDFSVLLTGWHQNGTWTTGDFTGDGTVDGSDFSVLLTNWHVRGAAAGSAGSAESWTASAIQVVPAVESQLVVSGAAVSPTSQGQGNSQPAIRKSQSVVKVNFQPADAAVPAGYLVDSGLPFGDKDNGFLKTRYGWVSGHPAAAVRDAGLATGDNSRDQRYGTFVSLAAGDTWEMALPNGVYSVKIVCGDVAVDGVYKVDVETIPAIDGKTLPLQRWLEQTVTVVVTDGRLTISGLAPCRNAGICFVEIAAAGAL